MSHLASLPSPAVNAAAGHAPVRPSHWKLTIIGEPESGLLLRVLQRLLVQQAVVGSLRYDQAQGEAQLEISFLADEEHARLAARRCETLIAVRCVTLEVSP